MLKERTCGVCCPCEPCWLRRFDRSSAAVRPPISTAAHLGGARGDSPPNSSPPFESGQDFRNAAATGPRPSRSTRTPSISGAIQGSGVRPPSFQNPLLHRTPLRRRQLPQVAQGSRPRSQRPSESSRKSSTRSNPTTSTTSPTPPSSRTEPKASTSPSPIKNSSNRISAKSIPRNSSPSAKSSANSTGTNPLPPDRPASK
jgi:hypothetical protein